MFEMKLRRLRFLALVGAVAGLLTAAMPVDAGARPVGEELTLSFDQQGWLNAISGEPVITGTLDCPAVAQSVYISLEAAQEDNGSYGYGSTTIDCDAPQVRWVINADGDFETGLTSLDGVANYEIETTNAERSDVTSLTACTRIGTMDDDKFVGTQKNDKICGLDGDDEFNGRGGNDTLRGGDGDDSIRGVDGNDILFGGYGEDALDGGTGDDKLSGNQHRDYLNGGTGNDDCDGGGGRDKLVSC